MLVESTYVEDAVRDGRWLNETGFVNGPAAAEPPF